MPFLKNIKYIDATLSEIWIVDKKFVVKKMKTAPLWRRGGRVVATAVKRAENSILAYDKMPKFFPKTLPITKDIYIREYFSGLSLEDNPRKLEYAIRKLKNFYLESMHKNEVKKSAGKMPFYGRLWIDGMKMVRGLSFDKSRYKNTPVYILGDAKPSNISAEGRYLSWDAEGFCVGDISSDIEAVMEHYQFRREIDALAKIIKLTGKIFRNIDDNVLGKAFLGLAAMRKMEFDSCGNRLCKAKRKKFMNEAIGLFKKHQN